MPRTYPGKALETVTRHPKCAFHARLDWEITFSPTENKKSFLKRRLRTFFFRKISHSAEKRKGDPLGFINIHSGAKYQNTQTGDSFETLKNFRKKIRSAEKKLKRGTLWSRPVL